MGSFHPAAQNGNVWGEGGGLAMEGTWHIFSEYKVMF